MRQSIHQHQHRSSTQTATLSHHTRTYALTLRFFAIAALLAALAMTLMPNMAHAAASQSLYRDSLAWSNWSWGTSLNPNVSNPSRSGRSLAVTFNQGWAGLSLYGNGGIDTSGLNSLQFSLYRTGGFPNMNVAVFESNGGHRQVSAQRYASSLGNNWYSVSIPLGDLGVSRTVVNRVTLQEATGSRQSTFYVDDLEFSGGAAAKADAVALSSSSFENVDYQANVSGNFKPALASYAIDQEIRRASAKYNLPRWFYYAIIHRESTFNRFAVSRNNDKGLTQLGGAHYYGTAYPLYLRAPNDNHTQYGYDMAFQIYGRWIRMSQVSPLYDPFDARQNLDRFSTGYAVPAFNMFKKRYGLSDTETLRVVAFHWNKGLFVKYNKWNTDYLGLYDKYVSQYKPAVERENGVWNGRPYIP